MKRLYAVLLVLLLLAAPICTQALSRYFDLSKLTNAELLQLQSDLEEEIEKRGLISSTRSTSTSKAADIVYVWVPKSGQKYHSKSTCSNMKNPKKVTLSEAKACGFTACKKCKPPN